MVARQPSQKDMEALRDLAMQWKEYNNRLEAFTSKLERRPKNPIIDRVLYVTLVALIVLWLTLFFLWDMPL